MLFVLILVGVLLNASAQLLLKAGMERIGDFAFSFENIWPIAMQVAANPYIIIGLSFYVLSVVVWLLVLSRCEVSFAYPMLSIGYIVNAIAAYYLFSENLSALRIAGIAVIIAGVCMVART